MTARPRLSTKLLAAEVAHDLTTAGRPVTRELAVAVIDAARERMEASTLRRAAAARSTSRRRPLPDWVPAVVAAVARWHDLTTEILLGNDRSRYVARARAEAAWMLRSRGLSLREVGRVFGDRDHAAITRRLQRLDVELAGDQGRRQTLLELGADVSPIRRVA